MKKNIILQFLILILTYNLNAQFSNTANPYTTGNVGIGGLASTGITKLYLQAYANYPFISTMNTYNNLDGGFTLLNSGGGAYDAPLLYLKDNQNRSIFKIGGADAGQNAKVNLPGIYNFEQVNLGQFGNGAGGLEFINHSSASSSYGVKLIANSDEFSGLQIKTATPNSIYGLLNYQTQMFIGTDGKVSIGSAKPIGPYIDYKLGVNGTIVAKKLWIETDHWADKVFDKKYSLMSLFELEKYISQNKHLPNIPSESEVVSNGLDVTEMQTLQMQKIEELTLYIIEQNKKIEAMQAQINNLKK